MQMECECVSDIHQHESDGKGQLRNHDWLSGQGRRHTCQGSEVYYCCCLLLGTGGRYVLYMYIHVAGIRSLHIHVHTCTSSQN